MGVQGRCGRADRYDDSGRHIATAVFPDSVHWIVAVTPVDVTAINRDGIIFVAPWGRPVPGEITP